jgi:uncharacterized membrane protein YphA (DoxX/SURF4 family)
MMNLSQGNLIKYSRIVLGIIFIWYGVLKFFPELSPAEQLAVMTIDKLFMGLIPTAISMKLLAVWEVGVGICLLIGKNVRMALLLFLIHMILTFTPLVLLPGLCFTAAPFAFTLVGQYILKNSIFILVGLMIYQNETNKKGTLSHRYR